MRSAAHDVSRGQLRTDKGRATYGYVCSEHTRACWRYCTVDETNPPWHPRFPNGVEQSSSCCSDKFQVRPVRWYMACSSNPKPANAQQLPHLPWSRTGSSVYDQSTARGKVRAGAESVGVGFRSRSRCGPNVRLRKNSVHAVSLTGSRAVHLLCACVHTRDHINKRTSRLSIALFYRTQQ